MKLLRHKGDASVILEIFIQDSSSAVGAGLTGLAHDTASLTCYYHRNTAAAPVEVSLVTMTIGTFVSGGFAEVDATNMPGVYQLCLPDAALAAGADSVSVILNGATNMAELPLEIQLEDNHYQARVWLTDEGDTADHYLVRWFKNGIAVTSGITLPTLQVVKPDDSDLIGETAMTAGTNGRLRYDATTTERMTAGVTYEIVVEAVIDSSTWTWYQAMSRDSA